jgi:hypothetical protein
MLRKNVTSLYNSFLSDTVNFPLTRGNEGAAVITFSEDELHLEVL